MHEFFKDYAFCVTHFALRIFSVTLVTLVTGGYSCYSCYSLGNNLTFLSFIQAITLILTFKLLVFLYARTKYVHDLPTFLI